MLFCSLHPFIQHHHRWVTSQAKTSCFSWDWFYLHSKAIHDAYSGSAGYDADWDIVLKACSYLIKSLYLTPIDYKNMLRANLHTSLCIQLFSNHAWFWLFSRCGNHVFWHSSPINTWTIQPLKIFMFKGTEKFVLICAAYCWILTGQMCSLSNLLLHNCNFSLFKQLR